MSNCLNIHTDITIPLKQVNTINLFHDMEEINKLEDVSLKSNPTLKEYIIWWFLSESNVYKDGDNLIISLGNHRSTHTWRDLNQTFHVLYEYIIGLNEDEFIHCPIMQSDEINGFKDKYRYDWIIREIK